MRLKQYLTEESKPELKDGEWCVCMIDKQKVTKMNLKTNRMKKFKRNKWLKTTVPPEERSFKNLPQYANDKPKVRFQDWLGLSGNPSKGTDGKWYGYSHRAVYGFAVGDVIKPGHIGNKYDAGNKWDEEGKDFDPYKIKTDKEAKEHALRFMKEVS